MTNQFTWCLFVVGVLLLSGVQAMAQDINNIPVKANWIWRDCPQVRPYNDTIIARKPFELPAVEKAMIRITADTEYRLFVNDQWVNDGPCRSWPNHFQYDEIDAKPYLKAGENEIRVIAKFFGTGTFHQVPQEPGLLVQMDALDAAGKTITIITDDSWEVAKAEAWLSNTPKLSVQMGPYEIYDARREAGVAFHPAVVRYGTHEGPWQGLMPRDVALLTKKPFSLKAFQGATVVDKAWRGYVFNIARLLYPDMVVKANNHNSMASALATIIDCKEAMDLTLESTDLEFMIDGKTGRQNRFHLEVGKHFLFAIMDHRTSHWRVDATIIFKETEGYTLCSPVDGNEQNPWCFVPFDVPQYMYADFEWGLMADEEKQRIEDDLKKGVRDIQEQVFDAASFNKVFDQKIYMLSSADEVMDAVHWQFMARKPIDGAKALVENPEALVKADGVTVVQPNEAGDIELLYDLGEQNCGYYTFEMEAEAGLVVDIAGVEYIKEDGTVQHTDRYQNDMRYICKEGVNTFTSLKRRSQRHVFITLRNQTKPVTIKKFQLIESTYPVEPIGSFACSDERLDKIWEISARTLKLCMEDTFTDCPLYEQTLWVGDARNEAVFGFTAFGAEDIAKRCVRLAGESLEQYPMILCQVPSTWETLLPAWSFLWGISVWDYYWYTGDTAFLEATWPWVMKNLEGAASFSDERGLFSGPFWNMFDWSGIDQGQNTVLHCSMLAVGAVDAALKSAEVLGKDTQWLQEYRAKLVNGLNGLWDEEKKSYPDSVHNDGSISKKTSVHTSFLALNYDIIPEQYKADAINNVLSPPEVMTKVGAPFAILYMYEALEKLGYHDRIMQSIYDSYLPMLEIGATTVWEQFPTGTTGHAGFPTRSHCHAWSSAPIHFLNRIVLGIVPTEAGGEAVTVSPHPSGLTWAKGVTATTNGPVEVEWKLEKDTMTIQAKGPEGVALQFTPNKELEGIKVVFNGKVL